jgi:hypothetical protein
MRLTTAARAGLFDELAKGFLIQRGLRVWHKDAPEAVARCERLKHEVARVQARDRGQSDGSDTPVCLLCGKGLRRRYLRRV